MMWSPLPQRYAFGEDGGSGGGDEYSLQAIEEREEEATCYFTRRLASMREQIAHASKPLGGMAEDPAAEEEEEEDEMGPPPPGMGRCERCRWTCRESGESDVSLCVRTLLPRESFLVLNITCPLTVTMRLSPRSHPRSSPAP